MYLRANLIRSKPFLERCPYEKSLIVSFCKRNSLENLLKCSMIWKSVFVSTEQLSERLITILKIVSCHVGVMAEYFVYF